MSLRTLSKKTEKPISRTKELLNQGATSPGGYRGAGTRICDLFVVDLFTLAQVAEGHHFGDLVANVEHLQNVDKKTPQMIFVKKSCPSAQNNFEQATD